MYIMRDIMKYQNRKQPEVAHVCSYVCCGDCVGVCGKVSCVAAVVEDGVFSIGVLKYLVCLCKGCDRCCVLCL